MTIAQHIVQYIAGKGVGAVVKKSELDEQFSGMYYHNGSKYISDALTRLVKSRILVRPLTGHYAINPNNPSGRRMAKNDKTDNPKLF